MSNTRLVCASCGAVWITASTQGAGARSERCLRCGGDLLPAGGEATAQATERPAYAVAGATGPVGRAIAVRLDGLARAQRLVLRDLTLAPRVAGAEASEASYDDVGALRRAFAGVKALALVSATECRDLVQQQIRTIEAAIAAGVERLVYVSVVGASADATYSFAREHFQVEQHLHGTGLPHTILRASYQLDLLPSLCSAEGLVQNPAGEGRLAGVARGDLADVAVAALTEDGHAGHSYDVTGPESQTMAEIAQQLELASGRRISYVREALDAARASRLAGGAPDWQAEAWASFFGAVSAGEMDVVSDTVSKLTGRAPQTFRDYLREHPESYRHLAAA